MSDHNNAVAQPTSVLDARGLNCPLPLLKAKKSLNQLSAGDILQVIATDPGSVRDFKVFAQQSGHQLIKFMQQGQDYYYWLEKTNPL